MPTLVITEGPCAGQSFDLFRHRLVMIGRDEDCTFQVRDQRVSRRHLQVKHRPDTGRHYAIDPGSANGVTVNGTRIAEGTEHELADGDVITIGHSHIVYTVESYPDAERAMEGVRQLGERRRSTLVSYDEPSPGDGGDAPEGRTPLH